MNEKRQPPGAGQPPDREPQTLTQYAIYEHPEDDPENYVVREWLTTAAGTQPGDSWRAPELEEARRFLPPGVERIEWDDPDPKIIEVWM
jgi:hypothetical protein